MSDYVQIERTKLQALLDVAVSSMDFGSGFWDKDDAAAARWAAEALGVCPNACTPTNIVTHFPPCEGLVQRTAPDYIGRDGRTYKATPSFQHVGRDEPTPDYLAAGGYRCERWKDGEWR